MCSALAVIPDGKLWENREACGYTSCFQKTHNKDIYKYIFIYTNRDSQSLFFNVNFDFLFIRYILSSLCYGQKVPRVWDAATLLTCTSKYLGGGKRNVNLYKCSETELRSYGKHFK